MAITSVRPVADLIQQARKGVLRRRVDEIARLVNLTDKEMAHILNMSVRGLHGKEDSERLSLAASERLLLLERLIQRGAVVFDGRIDLLSRWLHTPLMELAYREGVIDIEPVVPIRSMGTFTEPSGQSTKTAQTNTLKDQSSLVAQSPLAVLDVVSGFSLVDDVLGRIEWGIVG